MMRTLSDLSSKTAIQTKALSSSPIIDMPLALAKAGMIIQIWRTRP